MLDKKPSLITFNKEKKTEEETPFERFLRETESKLRKEEKHTWMVHDPEHLNQNE